MKNNTENISTIYLVEKADFHKQLLKKKDIHSRVKVELKKFLKETKTSIKLDTLHEWFTNEENQEPLKIKERDFTKIIAYLKCQPSALSSKFEYGNSFRANLKALITTKGLTNKQFAESIGVSESTVNSWTKIKAKAPKRSNMDKIIELYGIDYDYFVGRIEYSSHAVLDVHSKTGLSLSVSEMLTEHKQIINDYLEFKKTMEFPEGYSREELALIKKEREIYNSLPKYNDPELKEEYEEDLSNLKADEQPQPYREFYEEYCNRILNRPTNARIIKNAKLIDEKRSYDYFFKSESEKHPCMKDDPHFHTFLIQFLNNLLQPDILQALYRYVHPDIQVWTNYGDSVEVEVSSQNMKEVLPQSKYNESIIKKYTQEAALRVIKDKLDSMGKNLEPDQEQE